MRPLLPLPLLLLLALSGRGATVQTLDGRVLQGRLQLDSSGTFLLWDSNGPPTSIAVSNLARADFSNLTNAAPPLGPRLKPLAIDEDHGALPEPWENTDVGPSAHRGSAVHYHGKFTAEISKGTANAREDAYHFIYQSFRGNCEIIARIGNITPRDEQRQAAAGLILCQNTEPDASFVRVTLSGNGSISVRNRATASGTPVNSLSTMRRLDRKPPYWLKLSREDNVVSAFHSADGHHWDFIQQHPVKLPDRIVVGMLVLSCKKEVDALAEFDHVTVRTLEPRSSFAPRIVLRDGTQIVDHFQTIDETSVGLSKEKSNLSLLTRHVARVEFRPVEDPESLPMGRVGVLLSTGDFVEGDFRCVTNNKIVLSSVLFGQRIIPVDRKVAALMLRDPTPASPVRFEIRSMDGSVWRAQSVALEEDKLLAETALLGRWQLPVSEIREVARMDKAQAVAGAAENGSVRPR